MTAEELEAKLDRLEDFHRAVAAADRNCDDFGLFSTRIEEALRDYAYGSANRHTMKSFRAVTDKDAAIAAALGWRKPSCGWWWCRGEGNATEYHYKKTVPAYWTGDEPALCREMRDALLATCARVTIYCRRDCVEVVWRRTADLPDHYGATAETEGKTLCLALVAAGQVPKGQA